jgi:peptide/nickel transport system permease protein
MMNNTQLYQYIIRRSILLVVILFGISVIVFYLTRGTLPPAAAVASYITPRMTDPVKLEAARGVGVASNACPSWDAFISSAPGCVLPLWSQYFAWLRNVLVGNWGYSLIPGIGSMTTWQLFATRFPYTAELAVPAALLTIIVAIPMGIISATHNNKPPDHISRFIALLGWSLPIFWLAYALQLIFAIYVTVPRGSFQIGLLPTQGTLPTNCYICLPNPGTINTYTGAPILDALISRNLPYFWDSVVAIILPVVTLSFGLLGSLTRIMRSSMLEALRQDYVLLARSKGLRERVVIYRHALKNALPPAMTVAGLMFAGLLGGVVIIEYIFSWPGIGQAALDAAVYFDINFLELATLFAALVIVLANLVVDIMYAVIDPRIKY